MRFIKMQIEILMLLNLFSLEGKELNRLVISLICSLRFYKAEKKRNLAKAIKKGIGNIL